MSRFAFVRAAVACVIAGAALYVTRGVLDQVIIGGAATRVALLPPWQAFVGFICLACMVLVLVDHLNAPRGTTTFQRPKLNDLILPLFASGLLIVPYLPVLPDRLPVLQILAGPFRYVVWLVIGSQVVWVLWQSRLLTARAIEAWSLTRVTAVIWIASALIFLAAGERLTRTETFPSGDEPHYLILAQSIWRDHDLKIENNHKRGDYHEYYADELQPDYLVRGLDREIYSIHPVGLPFLIAPIYALGGYHAVVWFLILIAATAATLAWRLALRITNAPGATTFAWLAIAASAPFLLNSFVVFPEITAGLAVMIGFSLAATSRNTLTPVRDALVIGLSAAALPWLSTKYAPMSAVLLLVAYARWWGEGKNEPPTFSRSFLRNPKIWAATAPYAISLIAWSAFFYWIWGSPLPQAPYGTMTQTSPANWPLGIPGLLFDQEFGLVAYAPVYALAFTGLWAMWRAGGEQSRLAIEIKLIFGALLLTVAGHRLWWGGTSAPARPLASGMLLLLPAIATAYRAAPAGSARRSAQHLLLWISIGIAITLTLAQNGSLVGNFRDGTSGLLEWWLPRWEAWSLVPSFVSQSLATALMQTMVWVILAAGARLLIARARPKTAGAVSLTTMGAFAAALIVAAIIVPMVPATPPAPVVNLHSRARLAALDEFDARERPAAVLYNPVRKVASPEIVPFLRVDVAPGLRKDPQPIRVIHNGRFTLPAGSYDIEVTFGNRQETDTFPLALQLGRIGPAFETWSLQPKPGETFKTSLSLPVDVNFVGFRGNAELERDVDQISVTATSVVDFGARPQIPQVLSAARYGETVVFMHDEHLYPEPQGFWTIGDRPNRVTFASKPGGPPVVLSVHCGARANRMLITAHGWDKALDLKPGYAQEIELPSTANGVFSTVITTSSGFSPQAVDPASRDPRLLGVWVEVKQNR